MPHVTLKLAAGRSEAVKQQLADAFTASLVDIIGATEAQISVAIEDVDMKNWKRDVYEPEIEPSSTVSTESRAISPRNCRTDGVTGAGLGRQRAFADRSARAFLRLINDEA